VVVALTAALAGARSYAAIAPWGGDLSVEQRAQVGLTRPAEPEASTFRRVLAGLDLAADGGVVVSVDAMHTQTDTARLITDAGGDYVFTVTSSPRRPLFPAGSTSSAPPRSRRSDAP
jgi:predicted ABC-type transport system involved in lysophospholipase L1 biosynthesis ATPase subunit